MKTILYTTLVAIGLVLMACPYEGEVEINTYEESLKIDKKLIDHWVSFNKEGGRTELLIEKAAKSVLSVSFKQLGKNGGLEERRKFRAYATEINGNTIFNIETKENYLFSKYGWTGKNEFYMQFIESDYVTNNFKVDSVTTSNLRAFIAENVNKEDMYGEKMEFYRKDSPEYSKVKMFMRKSGF